MRLRRPFTVRKVIPLAVTVCGVALLAGHLGLQPDDAFGHPLTPPAAMSPVTRSEDLESSTIGRINALRRSHHLTPVRRSPGLARGAAFHAFSMARFGYFSHASRDGTPFAERIARFYPRRGFATWAVGENLLWSSPSVTPERAVSLWLGSPRHRRVLLDPRWREVGVQAVHVVAAPGVFKAIEVTLVVADFGTRVSP
jgi:uncharacterized protein YkwD